MNWDHLKAFLPQIGSITFASLTTFLFQKLSDAPDRKYTPSKLRQFEYEPYFGACKNRSQARVRWHEKQSTRLEQLKKDDKLITMDLVEHFYTKMRQLAANLQLQPGNYAPIVGLLADQDAQMAFTDLLNGVSPRYEKHKEE